MNKSIAVGVAVGAALLGLGVLASQRRERLGAFFSHRMLGHMERMMASLPDNAPPKLVMSVLPRVRDQNEEIIGMLREQNAMLRERLRPTP